MQWIPWDTELELGYAPMDEDHKALVALVNQLADRVINQPGPGTYDELLNQLLAHARTHFRMEEELMAAHRYPLAEQHRATHARLIREAIEFRNAFDAGTQPSVSLLYFFQQWLTRHIVTVDRELAQFLANSS